ncbi:MAG: DNA cytosine methyltransferase [Saprospiraceae bacterium]|nr:DNA cytosine methyltransferase [Candidatus Defluviibacterium haderslevense]
MNKLNFISLFTGASGMDEGFIKAGFHPIAHVEMNKDACFTIKTRAAYHYLYENKNSKIYNNYLQGKITRVDLYKNVSSEILNSVLNFEITDYSIKAIFTEIEKQQQDKKIDLIIGGPPCQAYSLLGRHQKEIENDPRNKLYIQYGRFLKEFKPKAFVFENVPGLLSANNGEHFKNLKIYFKKLGYVVYHKTLDASDFGALQARKRVIIVGWLKENDFGFPEIKNTPKKYKVQDALLDLPKLKPGEGFKVTKYKTKKNKYLQKFELRNGINFVTQHISRSHNDRDLAIYKIAIEKWNQGNERLKYIDLPAKLKTHKNLTSFLDRFKVVNGSGMSHTYDFYFEGSRSAAFKQIGNAVPPLMSYAIAQKMKELLCPKK